MFLIKHGIVFDWMFCLAGPVANEVGGSQESDSYLAKESDLYLVHSLHIKIKSTMSKGSKQGIVYTHVSASGRELSLSVKGVCPGHDI